MCIASPVRSELRRTDSASALSSWAACVVMEQRGIARLCWPRRVWRCCYRPCEAETSQGQWTQMVDRIVMHSRGP